MHISKIISTTLMTVAAMSFTACNGMFDGLYDDEDAGEDIGSTSGYGFVSIDEEDNSGTIYVDVTSYLKWTLIDFHSLSIDSLYIDSETLADPFDGTEPDWDIAVHRWDARTNGASVLETGYTGFSVIQSLGEMPSGTYVEDVESSVTADMSGMMDGDIGYSECYVNEELSKWIDVDTSSMPPSYSLSNKVYLVKLTDGTYIALRLTDYMNASGTKGYLTIEYIYPFEV